MTARGAIAAGWQPLLFLALAALPFVPDRDAGLVAQRLPLLFILGRPSWSPPGRRPAPGWPPPPPPSASGATTWPW